jgi:hypothetical protein
MKNDKSYNTHSWIIIIRTVTATVESLVVKEFQKILVAARRKQVLNADQNLVYDRKVKYSGLPTAIVLASMHARVQ